MRIRDLGRILQPVLIVLAAIGMIAPAASLAASEAPSGSHRDAIPDLGRPVGSGGERKIYTGVLISPLEVGFTKPFLAEGKGRKRRIRGDDVERMQRHYRDVVGSRLAPEFAIAEMPGPGVVRADAYLIDHVLDKRDWLAPVTTSYRSVPEVRIVVFLRDSLSDEPVDAVGLTLPPRANRLLKDGPGSYWSYMRLVFDRVATRMRWVLEDRAESSESRGPGSDHPKS